MQELAAMLIMIMIGAPLGAAPFCPPHTLSRMVRINNRQELVDSLASVVYSQSNCMIFTLSSNDHYEIDLAQLLALQVSFVITSADSQHVTFECVNIADMPVPLAGLDYVAFYRLSFHNCKIPLWVENVGSVVMEDVMFRLANTGSKFRKEGRADDETHVH